MPVFELVITLLLVGAVLAALARRLNAPYPALLALAGAALALLPNVPTVTLDPELALTLFVAPVLLDAAFDASTRDLRALSELRSSGVIGDDAFHRVEEELDWTELNTEGMAREV